jgi:acetylxylan esterase
MFVHAATLGLLLGGALAAPTADLAERASCPSVHVICARGTTDTPNCGAGTPVVTSILNAHSGATSESINYVACGGGSSCGGVSYSDSVRQGTAAVVSQVSAYAKQCPSTKLVLVGYSQVWTVSREMDEAGLTLRSTGSRDIRQCALRWWRS